MSDNTTKRGGGKTGLTPRFTPLALEILRDRYLWRDGEGNTIETPEQMLRRVARCAASAEPEKTRAEWEEKFYEIMARLDFLPNSPTLMNAGRPAPHGQLSACFVVGVEDSMESICAALRKQMLIHKSGGGTGFNFSKLRPKGAVVRSTNGKASGPVSFMRLFDLSTEVVQQGGCFTGDTLIATAEGAVKISELKEGTLVYSYHSEKGFILTPCTAPWLTKRNAEIWELETDKGLKIKATPDHPFMYRCGSAGRSKAYGKLKDLLPGAPLMPLSTCVKKGYRYIALHDGKDTRKPLHRWLMEQAGRGGEVIHHINGDPLDNRLSNLTNELTNSGHASHHNSKRIDEGVHAFQHLTPEQRKKAGAGYSKWYASLAEEEKQALRDKNAEALRIENARRIAAGEHNFVGDRHPSKDPATRKKQRKGRLAATLWYLQSLGRRPTAENIERLEKEAGLYNTMRYKLSSYVEAFGSFDNAMAYADDRNCKVKAVTPLAERADVWNVEIPETHNYVVCNEDCTTGVVVSNTRRGANMAILNADHPDIEEFISCKDEEGKITNFNLSVGITDEFMEKAMSAKDSPERSLLIKTAEHAWKTGDPGVIFLDALNRDNPCPQLGRIEGTNPCVTGDTPILTDKGYIPIKECVGKVVAVWNGGCFSYVTPRVTGENQPIMTLTFSDGSELKCTPYHKFYIQRGFPGSGGRQEKLEAKQLKVGDRLCKTRYPIINFEKSTMTPDEAYVNGFFTGDGTELDDGQQQLRLYDKKRALVDFFAQYGSVGSRDRDPINVSLGHMKNLKPKFWIPSDETLPNRLAWLAGLIDADGHRNSEDGSVSIASIHRDFLLDIRLMLNTCGVPSSLLPLTEARQALLPDGKGSQKLYDCQAYYRLVISAAHVKQLMKLGFQTKRVDLTNIKPNRNAGRYIKVEKIEYVREVADKVYCFNEPICHSGMFNGLLTGNCSEAGILANEACNLGSVNLSHMVAENRSVDYTRLRQTVRAAVRFLDDIIDVNRYPLPEIEEAVKKTRKIGLGVMGWADMLYKLHIPYDSEEALRLAKEIMSFIATTGHYESGMLAQERGATEWCAPLGRRNATVTCIAPTGTIALLADCSSGIEPIFSNHHTRKVRLNDGVVADRDVFNEVYLELVNDPSLSDDELERIAKTAYTVSPEYHLYHTAAFQRHTDLGVSKTINMPAAATVEDVFGVYAGAWRMGLKGVTIYRNGSRSSQVLTESALPPVRCASC